MNAYPIPAPSSPASVGQTVESTFQVHMEGILAIVSKHLYSKGADTVVRELLQNAVDAISVLINSKGTTSLPEAPSIEIECQAVDDSFILSVSDNGIGLDELEIETCLGTLAYSSKTAAEELLGQFGIGLFASFLVTDEIVILTRKVDSPRCLEWRGYSSGKWASRPVEGNFSCGTRVYIKVDSRKAPGFSPERVLSLTRRFGSQLPYPIVFRQGRQVHAINTPPFWTRGSEADLISSAAEFGVRPLPLGAFVFECPEFGAHGVACIQAEASSLGSAATHQLYVKRMLVGEHIRDIAPVRLPFLRCVLNADKLALSAARENIMMPGGSLRPLHRAIHQSFQMWLERLHQEADPRIMRMLVIHRKALMEAAADDPTLAALLLEYLPVETTVGAMSLARAARDHSEVHYAATEGEYFRMESKATQERFCLVRGFYENAHQLIQLAGRHSPSLAPRPITPSAFFARFPQPQRELDARHQRLQRIAAEELRHEQASISFEEADDPFVAATLELTGDNSLGRLLAIQGQDQTHGGPKRLILNTTHSLVEHLLEIPDLPEDQRRAWVRIIYTEALLSARESPSSGEARRHAKALDLLFKATFG